MYPGGYWLVSKDVRDLAPDCLADGRLKVMPASYYSGVRREERAVFALRHGLYCLPTVELVDWLLRFVNGRVAIEIGSGNGVLAQDLGIPATDSYALDDPEAREHYALLRQPIAAYGSNVERLEALEAVRKYKPEVVIGSWITHRFDASRPERGGNKVGPDLNAILKLCRHYVLIGNEVVHAQNPLWERPHKMLFPDWLYSRSLHDARDFIAIWDGDWTLR